MTDSRYEATKMGADIENVNQYDVSTDDSQPSTPPGEKSNLKYSTDGTVLDPQPSDSTDDPLNWSRLKKNTVFFSLLPGCFLTDWVITYGTTVFVPQAMEWGKTVPSMATSQNGAIFMQGPGGLLAVPLCQRYGRLPVLFWSQFFCLISTIGATYATSYAGFTACRTLQGFFGSPPQVIGLSMIYDLFFFEQRARKINIWSACFLGGPYIGPFISALIGIKLTWRPNFGVLCGFYGFSCLCLILFGDETLYDRSNPYQRTKGISGRIQLLLGITGVKEAKNRPSYWKSSKDVVSLIFRPYLIIPTFGFIMFMTMWTIGIVATISEFVLAPPRLFSQVAFALLYLAPLIGTFCGEIWGHWFNQYLQTSFMRAHNGVHVPEHRLWGVYPGWIIGLCGLVLFGQAIQLDLHWVAIAFGWGMTTFGTIAIATPISTYLLDVFPHQAAAASGWIIMARVAGGFSVAYFQAPWVTRSGAGVTFGVQAGIIGAAITSIIVMQLFGAKWRKAIPPPDAKEL